MIPDPNRPTLNVYQAMEVADVSRRTIYNWMRLGKIEYFKTAGGSPRIYRDSLFRASAVKWTHGNQHTR